MSLKKGKTGRKGSGLFEWAMAKTIAFRHIFKHICNYSTIWAFNQLSTQQFKPIKPSCTI